MRVKPSTKGLATPNPHFLTSTLALVEIEPYKLIRISTHNSNEPYFNSSGKNRFDDPNPVIAARYKTCYFGFKLAAALAETLLHDRKPVRQHFVIQADVIEKNFVLHYQGTTLTLANMTGAPLKRAGLHAGLSGASYYKTPQRWSSAIYHHPANVDGFIYMSRHLNTDKAVVLFDRAKSKIQMHTATPLTNYPGFARAAKLLGIKGA